MRLALVLAAAALILAATAGADQGRPDYCERYPALSTAQGAVERANKGWNAREVKTSEQAIRRVRIQRRCAPSQRGRRHVRGAIDHARHKYKKAVAAQGIANAYGDIDPPGEAYLAQLRACESGGAYSTNTGNGFYGAYQFDLQTWASVGGSGLPSDASPAEQDYRAALLWRSRGSSPWPVCG